MAQRNGARTGPNPYSTLNDIVNERCDDYDPDVDNLTLFTADRQHSAPKVAAVLSNLVKFPMGGESLIYLCVLSDKNIEIS